MFLCVSAILEISGIAVKSQKIWRRPRESRGCAHPPRAFLAPFFARAKKVRQQCAASTFTWRCDRLQFTRTGDRKRKLYFSRECVLLTSINQRIKIKTKVHLLKRKSRRASHEWGEWMPCGKDYFSSALRLWAAAIFAVEQLKKASIFFANPCPFSCHKRQHENSE